jgi:hypothetical protein
VCANKSIEVVGVNVKPRPAATTNLVARVDAGAERGGRGDVARAVLRRETQHHARLLRVQP